MFYRVDGRWSCEKCGWTSPAASAAGYRQAQRSANAHDRRSARGHPHYTLYGPFDAVEYVVECRHHRPMIADPPYVPAGSGRFA